MEPAKIPSVDPAPADLPARDCPSRPTSFENSPLGFVPRPMVRWLDPRQLVDTTFRVVLSGIFGSYADKRELQAMVPSKVSDRSNEPDLWLDYVADLGDGWNPTYTMARLLARQELDLDRSGERHATRRGQVLVMGGDQAYPVPNRGEYEDRMLGPYRAAMPCTPGRPPQLLAIPGSHDWYDGLVNFAAVFCRGHWIGGWRTEQSRSYFALKLPHRWWLWGVDIQFGAYIDEAQLGYFSQVAAEQVEKGDRLILCLAKDVGSGRSADEIYSDRNLDYFEREIIRPAGAEVRLYLRSGRHHYCRYEEENGPRHHVTAGGGGAFLHPTHHLPDHLELPRDGSAVRYRRAAAFPSPAASKRLRKRLWLLPARNLPFAGLLGSAHVLVALLLGLHLDDRHSSLGLGDLWQFLWESPTAVVLIGLMVVMLGAMVRLAHEARGLTRLLLGAVHALLQLVSLAGFIMAASAISTAGGGPKAVSLSVFLVALGVLGGLGGSLGMAAYLWATNLAGFHGNEAYAPLRIMDFKHFLRLRIDTEGELTVYPIGVERVGRRWRAQPEAALDEPWFAPDGPEVEAHLIEEPIRIVD